MLNSRLAAFLCALSLWPAVAAFPAGAERHPDSEQDLTAHIERARNPVSKAKYEIRLAELKLRESVSAYDEGQLDQGQRHLGEYLASVRAAWKLLKDSGRDATRKSGGFRELDIALREDARQIEDVRRRVAYTDRGPLDATAKEIDQTHSQVIAALFPSGTPAH